MVLITSPANPRIKQFRKLRDRKERQASGLFSVEGVRIVAEAFQLGAGVEELIVAPDLLTSEFAKKLVAEQAQRGLPVLEVSPEVFAGISAKEGPAGLAATVRQKWEVLEDIQVKAGQTWIALEAVADPGNLGTILRTNDAVGGSGVILLEHSTDPYDPTAIRASMGAIFSQRLVRASLDEFSRWKQMHPVVVIGTSDKARMDYQAYRYPSELVLLMGSERQGLQEQALNLCDEVVRIPMAGRSDSLNLAVATGVVLYEIYNQHRSRVKHIE